MAFRKWLLKLTRLRSKPNQQLQNERLPDSNTNVSIVPPSRATASSQSTSTPREGSRRSFFLLPPELHLMILERLSSARAIIALQRTHPVFRNLFIVHGKTFCAAIEARMWKQAARDVVDIIDANTDDYWMVPMTAYWGLESWTGLRSSTIGAIRSHLEATSSASQVGLARLVALETIYNQVVRPEIEDVLLTRLIQKKVHHLSSSEIERLEDAIYNTLRMSRFIYGLALDSERHPCLWEGDIVIRGSHGFDCKGWDTVLDVKGLCENLTIEQHMNLVGVLTILEGFGSRCTAFHFRRLLTRILPDRLFGRRKVNLQERNAVKSFVERLVVDSIWDKAQGRLHEFICSYFRCNGWPDGLDKDRYRSIQTPIKLLDGDYYS
ncbi:hypothetical protein BJ508DRAFT_378735 [Ascobolus immersus RN42]|uniref:F-box domain-containing protein n=1 Tax=Ascobolus immersus RN42 TaxID=1160509 RepID=A0A3N4HV69_ASCIM|nr:hypothetical protein BJ508DRAFT_378735 [Ascobolus immersus RN42]